MTDTNSNTLSGALVRGAIISTMCGVVVFGAISLAANIYMSRIEDTVEKASLAVERANVVLENASANIEKIGNTVREQTAGASDKIGDGGANIVDKVGTAFEKFRRPTADQ